MKRTCNSIMDGFVGIVMLFLLFGCSEVMDYEPGTIQRHAIQIEAAYPATDLATRVVLDGGFTSGDQIGLFVNYQSDKAKADNVLFTLQESGQWQAAYQQYWVDDTTKADFYAYYPYNETVSLQEAYTFSVAERQDGETTSTGAAGYAASDLLVARQSDVSPTSGPVNLQFRHLMAGVTISLKEGDGFSVNEWGMLAKTVLLHHVKTVCNVNLREGMAKLTDDTNLHTIVPLLHQGAWRAVVPPQCIEKGTTVISVTIEGRSYELRKDESLNLLSGKMHNLTIKVNRCSESGDFELELLPTAITAWTDDSRLHEGLMREYLVVNITKEGTLEKTLAEMGVNYNEVNSLKVSGCINQVDLDFMGQQMMQLVNLNLSNAVIEGGVITGYDGRGNKMAFFDHEVLKHIQLPEHSLRKIGDAAFYNAGLTGSLIIPEGVEVIEESAFRGCKCNGTLSLPSTLKSIGKGAFFDCAFKGELLLPEGLEYMGMGVGSFDISDYEVLGQWSDFSGTLTLPKSLKTLGHLGYPKLTGDLVIPDTWTEIPELTDVRGVFWCGGFDGQLILPQGIKKIGAFSFANTKICGEVKIPTSCKLIGKQAFAETRISSVVLPDEMNFISFGCFYKCERLSGTVTWPNGVSRVSENVFYGCRLLSGIVLHGDVSVIGSRAFFGCTSLLSIVCESEEPPLVGENAFLGVPKSDVIVEVPMSAVEKYRNAEGWKDFKRIVAIGGFGCRPSSMCALNKGYEGHLIIDTQDEWTVIHKPDWCDLSQTNGHGKTEIMVSINPLNHGIAARQDSVVFQSLADGTTAWCKLRQYDYVHEEDECITLDRASRGNGVDIVFVGDGWDAESISDGSYLNLVKYQTECFFAIEPYRSMRDYFNVYVTFPLSQDCGVNTMYTYVNNRFSTLHGESELTAAYIECCTTGKLISDIESVEQYVKKHTPIDDDRFRGVLIILVPNTTDYGGNTILNEKDDRAVAICPPSELSYPRDTRGIIQHEAGGHGFGKLADENIVSYKWIGDTEKSVIREMQWRGWFQNISLSASHYSVPWSEFVFDPYYSEYVDVFEGGYGYSRGVFRAEQNSCMSNYIPYYNTPSRLSIWRRIKIYAGEVGEVEDFRAQDTFEWGSINVK